jgi:hypothetical protein
VSDRRRPHSRPAGRGKAGQAAARAKEKAQADARIIQAVLRALATQARMIDMDWLKLVDVSSVTVDEAGDVQGAVELLEALRRDKPYLFEAVSTSTPGRPPPSKLK